MATSSYSRQHCTVQTVYIGHGIHYCTVETADRPTTVFREYINKACNPTKDDLCGVEIYQAGSSFRVRGLGVLMTVFTRFVVVPRT